MGLPRQHKAHWIAARAALTVLVAPCFLPTCYPVTSGETGPLWAGAEGATAPETLRQKDRVTSDIWKEALGFSPMRPPTG
ncbi:hypothetical protein BRSPCE3_40640 [Bradyrhizobium sp. Ce-3]|nr:hypothetical protein BRSPCE3_40640 [Bradyrhizobium sp. Ce-3]